MCYVICMRWVFFCCCLLTSVHTNFYTRIVRRNVDTVLYSSLTSLHTLYYTRLVESNVDRCRDIQRLLISTLHCTIVPWIVLSNMYRFIFIMYHCSTERFILGNLSQCHSNIFYVLSHLVLVHVYVPWIDRIFCIL